MATINGVVEWAGENKFGGHSIKVDGNYFNSKFPIKCEVGDTVEFDSGTTGKYCNKLRVVTKGSGAPAGGGSAPVRGNFGQKRGVFPIPNDDGQRSIIRQNALSRAVEVVALCPDDLSTRDQVAAEMIRLAMEFERYTSGDVDAEAQEEAKAKLAS